MKVKMFRNMLKRLQEMEPNTPTMDRLNEICPYLGNLIEEKETWEDIIVNLYDWELLREGALYWVEVHNYRPHRQYIDGVIGTKEYKGREL